MAMADEELIEIPYDQLSEDALRGVLEEYATRGGYESDMSLDGRVKELEQRLKAGKAKIMFSPKEGTTNLVTR